MSHDILFGSWVELVSGVLLIGGLILAIIAPNLLVTYVIVFLCGMIGGRLVFERKHDPHFPYVLMLGGLLIGLIIGSLFHRGNPLLIALVFILGTVVCYQCFNKKLVKDTFI